MIICLNKNMNMKNLADEIVAWLKNYAETSGRKAWVIGVSGGVDSALVSTLCAMTGLTTHCVVLPCHSKPKETIRGIDHVQWLTDTYPFVSYHNVDLSNTFDEFVSDLEGDYDSELAYANTKSRLRMIALYQIATCVGGLVVGTGNKVEDFGVGFFTKYGDGGCDISPIADLTKTEVRAMAKELGVSDEIVTVAPTDGLWPDARTDESQLGASYEELEWAMSFLELPNWQAIQISDRQKEVLATYNKWHKAGAHKLMPIPTFKR